MRIWKNVFFWCFILAVMVGVCLAENRYGLVNLVKKQTLQFITVTQHTGISHIFKKGGPIMWPLLFASILALGTVIECVFFLLNVRRHRNTKAMANFFAEICHGKIDEAIKICDKSNFYVLRTLGYALKHRGKSLSNALLYASEQEMKNFRFGIPILDTVITLAPLLGLLGTVTGMMGSFSLIGGELSAPGAITGGIAEALIATAFGLGIAITSLIPFNFLNTRMEKANIEIETAARKLEFLMYPNKTKNHRQKDIMPGSDKAQLLVGMAQ